MYGPPNWQQPHHPHPPLQPVVQPPRGGGAGPVVAIVAGVLVVLFVFAGVITATVLYVRAKESATPTIVGPKPTSTSSSSSPSSLAWDDSDSPVPVTSRDPMKGDRAALVTLVVFSDFQCPFCGRLAPTLNDARKDYKNDELRIVWKNQPLAFHKDARPAAIAAQGVFELGGSAAFWQFHDEAFKNQYTLDSAHFEAWAASAGVSVTDWNDGIAKGSYAAKVDEDALLAKTVGASGTPTSFINGIMLAGAQPLSKFETTIDDELSKARAKVAAGTALDRIYVTMSKENFRAPATPLYPSTGGGLVKTDLVIGTGAMAIRGDKVTVHYTGTLESGAQFDSSVARGTPFTFELGAGQVIKGWDQGVAGMRVGGKRKLVIPPELAYGAAGSPPTIPPNAKLVFEVELLSIK